MAHLLLIDALNLIRRIYAVDCEQPGLTDEQIIKSCLHRVKNATRKLLKTTQATHAIAVFDGERSWRYHLYADYKANRKPMPEALKINLEIVSQGFNENGVKAYFPQQDEADDIIATLAFKSAQHNVHATIVSTDKGFLPMLDNNIQVYDYFKQQYINDDEVESKFTITKDKLHDFWGLMGDKTNDIPGVKGIGKKTALEILSQYGTVENAVQSPTLKDSVRKKLEADMDNFVLSKVLVALRTDIEMGFKLSQLRLT
ncbi:flap endonuclease Xni [Pseudoalteromonas luteoviolacea]|uniref:Flap endonuclease Xni n=1 Tax=Pseudoalteromonas luteoviolacea TaxID=43657 RepID=A0A1C0TRW6_9GAMM|nr:flap endonuclease Xni [Pseudoalteromonas luteoviolacea]MBQ4810646.1 flap endonuclease Xni [Pseudoalteromonas luteoviolacea]OCQ22005.1 flap endonuclease Xni [Pseudoalteromonas luteoviolacea]